MSIVDMSVKRPVAMSMLLLIVMFIGLVVSFNLPVDFLPDIEYPIVTVSTQYSGAGPEEVESAVTRPLENALSTVENITEITSTSREGSSSIRLEFSWGEDLDQAAFNIREKIDIVRNELPDTVDSVRLLKYSTEGSPVLGLLLVGLDDPSTAYDLAENQIKKSLEQVSGVGEVTISGGLQTEVHIELTKNRLQAYNIDAENVARIVKNNDISSSGGYVFQGTQKFGVRVDGELKTLASIRDIVVSYRDGSPVFLSDIAEVYYGAKEDNPRMFVTGSNISDESSEKAGVSGVLIEVIPSSGANTVDVEQAVQKRLKEIQKTLPTGVSIEETSNAAEDIRDAIKGVTNSTILGGFFALLIMFFYLWDWRSLLVLGLSIPTSIIVTFIAMFLTGTTYNIMSMSGLTLAVGMMVDSSIVVLENIFRHRSEGQGRYSASIDGTKEVSLAIIASTFTTIAVFFPILFVEGRMAQLFFDLVVTVVVGLLASLMISITLVPMLCSLLIEKVHLDSFDEVETLQNTSPSAVGFNNRVLHQIDVAYKKALTWCIQHKKRIVFGGNILVIVLILFFVQKIPKEYMPASEEGNITIYLTYPLGTRYEYNESISRDIMKQVRDVLGSDLKHITMQVKQQWGGSISDHKSRMRITLVPSVQRKKTVEELVAAIRPVLGEYPVKNYVSTGGHRGRSGGESLSLQLQGNDLEEMNLVADEIIEVLKGVEGLKNPRKTSDDATPEIKAVPDRVSLARSGLTIRSVFSTIRTAFGGRVASTMLGSMGNDIDMRVRIRDGDRASVESLLNLNIPTAEDSYVSFGNLAEVREGEGPTWIRRADSIRVMDIRAGVSPEYAKDIIQVVEKVQQTIASKIYIPISLTLVYKGDYEDTKESMLHLTLAFLGAVFIVYGLMAALFESYIAPFVIMISVPFGALGSMMLLFIAGHTLNVYSVIGIVILVGIVINNGIVLIDYMNKLLAENIPADQAALQAGIRRIRPVCMTTFTTVLGMIPMALGLGEGGEDYAPLATSVIGGLAFSLIFTLLIVPVAYAGIRKRFPLRVKHEDNDTNPAILVGAKI